MPNNLSRFLERPPCYHPDAALFAIDVKRGASSCRREEAKFHFDGARTTHLSRNLTRKVTLYNDADADAGVGVRWRCGDLHFVFITNDARISDESHARRLAASNRRPVTQQRPNLLQRPCAASC